MSWTRFFTLSLSTTDVNLTLAPAGIPGNDDQAAMASLLVFHLLGIYPGMKSRPNYRRIGVFISYDIYSTLNLTVFGLVTLHTQVHHPQFIHELQYNSHGQEF